MKKILQYTKVLFYTCLFYVFCFKTPYRFAVLSIYTLSLWV